MLTFEVIATFDEVTVKWKSPSGSTLTADRVAEEIGIAAAKVLGYATSPNASFNNAQGGGNSLTWKKPVERVRA